MAQAAPSSACRQRRPVARPRRPASRRMQGAGSAQVGKGAGWAARWKGGQGSGPRALQAGPGAGRRAHGSAGDVQLERGWPGWRLCRPGLVTCARRQVQWAFEQGCLLGACSGLIALPTISPTISLSAGAACARCPLNTCGSLPLSRLCPPCRASWTHIASTIPGCGPPAAAAMASGSGGGNSGGRGVGAAARPPSPYRAAGAAGPPSRGLDAADAEQRHGGALPMHLGRRRVAGADAAGGRCALQAAGSGPHVRSLCSTVRCWCRSTVLSATLSPSHYLCHLLQARRGPAGPAGAAAAGQPGVGGQRRPAARQPPGPRPTCHLARLPAAGAATSRAVGAWPRLLVKALWLRQPALPARLPAAFDAAALADRWRQAGGAGACTAAPRPPSTQQRRLPPASAPPHAGAAAAVHAGGGAGRHRPRGGPEARQPRPAGTAVHCAPGSLRGRERGCGGCAAAPTCLPPGSLPTHAPRPTSTTPAPDPCQHRLLRAGGVP